MSAIRTFVVAAVLLNVTVQADDLADAIARRGQPVDVRPGQHHLKVPCDSIKRGSFADITVTIDDDSKTRLRLQECGVQVDSH